MKTLTLLLSLAAGAAQAGPIVGMSGLTITTADGRVYEGVAWNDFEVGRFCLADHTDHTCYGHFPAYWGEYHMSVEFTCNDGAAGTADMNLVDRVFLGHDLLVPDKITGQITSNGVSTPISGTFGNTYLDFKHGIACRPALKAWERTLPPAPTSILPE